jgi:hypothetical protein
MNKYSDPDPGSGIKHPGSATLIQSVEDGQGKQSLTNSVSIESGACYQKPNNLCIAGTAPESKHHINTGTALVVVMLWLSNSSSEEILNI